MRARSANSSSLRQTGNPPHYTLVRQEQKLICHVSANPEPDTAGQDENTQQAKSGSDCISLQKPGKKTSQEAYRIEGVEIHTLSDFISQYYRVSGMLPEWKPSVWQTLAKLKQQLSAS